MGSPPAIIPSAGHARVVATIMRSVYEVLAPGEIVHSKDVEQWLVDTRTANSLSLLDIMTEHRDGST